MIIAVLMTVLFLFSLIAIVKSDNTPIIPSKIKTNINRIRKTTIRNNFKESKLQTSQVYQNNLITNKQVYGQIDPANHIGLPIYEIHVRRKDFGLWTRFKDILGTKDMVELENTVLSGGINDDISRPILDKLIIKLLFGNGLGGDKVIYNELIQVLPQYKKTNKRFLQYGYKTINDNTIWSLDITPDISLKQKVLDDIITGNNFTYINDIIINNNLNDIRTNQIKNTLNIQSEITDLVICSDGGAIPISNKDNVTRFLLTGGIVLQLFNNETNQMIQINMCINNNNYIISNPFDSELIIGVIALNILNCINLHSHTNIKFMSDSKNLIRQLKSSQNNNNVYINTTIFHDNKDNIRDKFLNYMEIYNQKLYNHNLKYIWIPGHPERRISEMTNWSEEDNLIWIADNLCQKSIYNDNTIIEKQFEKANEYNISIVIPLKDCLYSIINDI